MPDTVTPVGKITPVNVAPKTAPVGKITPVGQEVVTEKGFDPLALTPQEKKMQEVGKIVDNLDFTGGYNDDEKKYLINLAKNPNIDYTTWNDAKLTVGGEHPKQDGQQTYYFDDKTGLPVPLAQSERPPKGKEIESVWGSQASAEDDSIMTTIGKNLANTIPNFIQSVGDVINLPYGLVTGNEADWYKDLKNETESHKARTSTASNKGFLDLSNVNDFEDLTKSENWNFTPDNVAGNVSQLVSTVLQFMAGGAIAKGIGLGAKSIMAIEEASAAGTEVGIGTKALAKMPYLASSYTNNLATSLDASDNAGITGREKYAIASLVTLPVSAVETMMGLTGKIASNPELKAERDAMIKGLVKGWKTEGGEMTKESLKELYDNTLVASSSIFGKMAKSTVVNMAGEASEEVLQDVLQKSSEQIYDSLYAQNKEVGKGKYGTDITSPKAFAEYLNDAIAGALGGGIGGAGVDKYKRAKAELQSQNAYDYIKQGPDAVQGLKASVTRAMDKGTITPEQHQQAIFKIDTYQKYYDQVKDLNLPDEANRRISDLTWSNGNLKLQQEELSKNPESNVKGTIPHRRLLDTEAILEANSKEMSEIMGGKIADQQTAVAVKVTEKNAENKKTVHQAEKQLDNLIPLKEQIKSAQTEKDLDAFVNEADKQGITTPDLIDEVGKRRAEIKAITPIEPITSPIEEIKVAPEHKEFVDFTQKKFAPELDYNNLRDVSNSAKADAMVEFMDSKDTRELKSGTIMLGRYANKILNGVKHPLYYAVNFGGKEIKFASNAFTKFIKEKNLVDRKVDVQLIKPTDTNLDELVKEGIIEPHTVVERTDAQGKTSKFFVFDGDENKTRHPYILVARALTKSGKAGVKLANLAISDYGKGAEKGREGVRFKKPILPPETTVSETENKASEKKGVNIPSEEREIDYEAQLQQAEETTIESLDRGFTASNKDENTTLQEKKPQTKKEFVNEQIKSQIDDGDFKSGSELEKISRKLWETKWELLNNYKISEDATENREIIEQLPDGDVAEQEPIVKDIEGRGENPELLTDEQKEEELKKIKKIKDAIKKKYGGLNFLFKKAMSHDVTSAYDQVLQYFIGGGTINVQAIDALYGGKGREDKVKSEVKARKYLDKTPLKRKTDSAIERLAEDLYAEQNGGDVLDVADFVNAIEEVVSDFNTRADMATHLNEAFKDKKPNIDTTKENEDDIVDETKKPKDKLNDDDIIDINPVDDDYVPPFQKDKGELSTDDKEARSKMISLLKKSIPGVIVVEDDSIGEDIAGQWDARTKTITLNPNYNYADTPIHEFGHVLIDILGGMKSSLIEKGTEQLKGTKLWAETKERYPELSDDMLAKEVLAEAIGREGVNVFDTKEKQSKFKNWLDGLFYAIKRLLGIEKNIAKSLANQLLSGKRIASVQAKDSEIQTQTDDDIQKQKNKEAKSITSSRPMSYKKWLSAQKYDEFATKEEIVNIKEDIEQATGEEKMLLEGRLELLEQSLEFKKMDYENYVADHKAIVDFIESKGDVSELSLDELYEIKSQITKFDDFGKMKIYKDLLYNIAIKINQLETAELVSKHQDYNPEVEQSGDLTQKDVWAQGLSTIGAEFPAIQAFFKQYRKASGEMNREISSIQQKGQQLAKKVIKEYQSKHGVAERLKNFTIGGGNKYFSFLAKDGELVTKGSAEYNKLTPAQKELLDFIAEQKSGLDKYMETNENVLLKSSAGFIETIQKSGLFKAYANYITNNHNLRNVKVQFKNPETGKTSEEYFGDVEAILNDYAKKGHIAKVQALALLTKYNFKARAGLGTIKHGKGKYFLRPDGKLVSMFGGEFKGDFTENYYETFMKYAQDAVFSKNMSPLMPTLTGIEMMYKSMGSNKENVSKFLDVVKRGKFLGETIESGLGAKSDNVLRLLRKWTSWRFIAFNIPANLWNIAVGEYNQFRADGGKQYVKGKGRMIKSMMMGRKNAKAMNILKNYYPDLVTDINRIDPEKHIGRYFDMLAFGGQKVGEAIIRGGAVLGKLSTEHYNWFNTKGEIIGKDAEEIAKREAIVKKEIDKYISEVERVQGRYSDVEKRNFAHFELGQFFGQFKVWMPEWLSDRFANTYIDADGVKRKGSFYSIFTYGMRDFLRDARTKEFYTSNNPKHVAMRKQLRGMITTTVLLSAYLGASNDDDDKDMAYQLDKALRNISGIYRMDNNQFMISQPAAAMSTVVDLAKLLDSAMKLQVIKSGKNKGDLKALDIAYNLIPAKNLVQQPIDFLTDSN